MKKDSKKLSRFEVFSYGLTSPGSGLGLMLCAAFISVFWTNVVGIPAAVVGTIFLFARLFDGVTDLIMGTVIDRTHTRFGKAKPWLLVGGIGVMVFTTLIFSVPNISMNGKIVYSFTIYLVLTAVFGTMSSISCPTLNNLITKDATDRVRLGSIYFVVYFVSVILVSYGINYVEKLGGGQKGWINLSLGINLIAAIMLVVALLGIKERVGQITSVDKKEKATIKEILSSIIHNKYFFSTMGIYLSINIYNAMVLGVGVYYSLYILKNMSSFTVLMIASYVPCIIGTLITPALGKRFGMSKVVLIGNVITIIGYLLIAVRPTDLIWVSIFIGVGGFGSGAISANINPYCAMSADYGEYKNGKPMPGIYSGGASFGTKVGSALGGAICGFILSFAGYNGLAETQTVATQNAIIGCYAIAPAVLTVILAVFCLPFFKLEKEYDRISEELINRRSEVK